MSTLKFSRFITIGLMAFLASCSQNLVSPPPPSPPDPSLLAVSSQDELWWISLSQDRQDVKVGPIRTASGQRILGVFDLAWDGKSSSAWALGDSGGSLYKVQVASGVATRVGSTGAVLNGLALDAQGRLFGIGGSGVYELNPLTGAASAIPGVSLPCDSSGDAAFGDALYASVSCGSLSGDSLVKVDLASKQAILVGTIGFEGVYGLSFKDGVLYGATSAGGLLRIDTSTGAGTRIRFLPFGVYGTQGLH